MKQAAIPAEVDDPVNARILAISEDKIAGFVEDPFAEISKGSGIELPVVLERIRAMLAAGVIRRVRQTLLANNLSPGALIAWEVPQDKLAAAFDFLFEQDPFSGHVVIRTTDTASAGSQYRLWTTLKVPTPYDLGRHCQYLASKIGAVQFRMMPAKKLFVLGVGHVRRQTIEPGDKTEAPGQVIDIQVNEMTHEEWRILAALKREFEVDEIQQNPWKPRAAEAGVSLERFLEVARSLQQREVIGRFSTFLEHVKPSATGKRVTKFNALFHWAVPQGRELEAGREVGRFHILTHGYWREGGPEFHNVNIMAVAHGTDKQRVLDHKAAIDRHLAAVGIPVSYTNVFWGGRSEIKPSEISPLAYAAWCKQVGIDPQSMMAKDGN